MCRELTSLVNDNPVHGRRRAERHQQVGIRRRREARGCFPGDQRRRRDHRKEGLGNHFEVRIQCWYIYGKISKKKNCYLRGGRKEDKKNGTSPRVRNSNNRNVEGKIARKEVKVPIMVGGREKRKEKQDLDFTGPIAFITSVKEDQPERSREHLRYPFLLIARDFLSNDMGMFLVSKHFNVGNIHLPRGVSTFGAMHRANPLFLARPAWYWGGWLLCCVVYINARTGNKTIFINRQGIPPLG